MHHLVKLALAIRTAQIRNAEDFLELSSKPKELKDKDLSSLDSTSPTAEEQRLSERGAPFGDSLDLSVEPSTEYLN